MSDLEIPPVSSEMEEKIEAAVPYLTILRGLSVGLVDLPTSVAAANHRETLKRTNEGFWFSDWEEEKTAIFLFKVYN